jgi:outer membrane protein OmpA-like peptidoglycan-associated protein
MTKQVIRPMMKARRGSIVNMSSIIGIRGNAGQSSYAASKAGIIGFTKSVAQELGSRNIRCNAIAPGFIASDMTAATAERMGVPFEDFKEAIAKETAVRRVGVPDDKQGEAIKQNAAATEALRGRLGDIDKYNLKSTTNVYFDTGKAVLSPGAKSELCAAAQAAGANENSLMLVLGYTDSTGSQDVNQALSEKRAAAVVNHLQQACKWKPYRMLIPTGMATSDPAADNTTPAGRAQNRRVSVNVLVSKALDRQ